MWVRRLWFDSTGCLVVGSLEPSAWCKRGTLLGSEWKDFPLRSSSRSHFSFLHHPVESREVAQGWRQSIPPLLAVLFGVNHVPLFFSQTFAFALAFNESTNCNNLSEVIQFDSEKFTLCNRFSSSGKQSACFCIPLFRMWFSVLVWAVRKGWWELVVVLSLSATLADRRSWGIRIESWSFSHDKPIISIAPL